MSFQFGTNWPGYMNTVGAIAGPAARLRGPHRLLPRGDLPRRDALRHEPRARLAAHHRRPRWWPSARRSRPSGSSRSTRGCRRPRATSSTTARWIAGDWIEVIFNPVVPVPAHAHADRLGAHRVVRDRGALGLAAAARTPATRAPSRRCAPGIVIAAALIPVQILVGDLHGLNTLKHQPAKIAAMEAIWETRARRAAGALRDPQREGAAQRLRDRARPTARASSSSTTPQGELKGIERRSSPTARRWPPVFFGFRIMVGHRRADAAGVVVGRVGHAPRERRAPRWMLWALRGLHLLRAGSRRSPAGS